MKKCLWLVVLFLVVGSSLAMDMDNFEEKPTSSTPLLVLDGLDLEEDETILSTSEIEELAKQNYAEIDFPSRMDSLSAEHLKVAVAQALKYHRQGSQYDRRGSRSASHKKKKIDNFQAITENDFLPLLHAATRFGGYDTMLDEFVAIFQQDSTPQMLVDGAGATLIDVLYYLLEQKHQHLSFANPTDKEALILKNVKAKFKLLGKLADPKKLPPLFEYLRELKGDDTPGAALLVDEVFLRNFMTLQQRDAKAFNVRRKALSASHRFKRKSSQKLKSEIQLVVPVGFINGLNPFNHINLHQIVATLMADFITEITLIHGMSEKSLQTMLKSYEAQGFLDISVCTKALNELKLTSLSLPPLEICLATHKVLYDSIKLWLSRALKLDVENENLVWLSPSDLKLTDDSFANFYEDLEKRLAPRYPTEDQWISLFKTFEPCQETEKNFFNTFPEIAMNGDQFVTLSITRIARGMRGLDIPPTDYIVIPEEAKSFSLLAMIFVLTKGAAQLPTVLETPSRNVNGGHWSLREDMLFTGNVWILDDVGGSGNSLGSACEKVLSHGATRCSVAAVLLTDQGKKFINGKLAILKKKAASAKKEAARRFYDNRAIEVWTSPNHADTVDWNEYWMGDRGHSNGQYFIFFQYMIPDNNVFSANRYIGPLFTDWGGIKNFDLDGQPSFRHFEGPSCLRREVVKKPDLDALKEIDRDLLTEKSDFDALKEIDRDLLTEKSDFDALRHLDQDLLLTETTDL